MKQACISCIILLFASAVSHAQDEPLPERVAQAYLAYETAMAAGDEDAASRAAEQAFTAAREVVIAEELQLTLGLNALAVAQSRGAGSGLTELTHTTAALADGLGDHEAGFDARMLGVVAAGSNGDFVAFDTLYPDMLAYAVENRNPAHGWLLPMARIDSPRSGDDARMPEAGVLELDLERARVSGDINALANAAIALQRDAMNREDWTGALDVTRIALAELEVFGAEARPARDSVAVFLSDILRDGFASTDSGAAHLSGDVRLVWCDYLSRYPVALDHGAVVVPMQAVARGNEGVVRTEFVVPAAGGPAEPGVSESSPRSIPRLRSASRDNLGRTHFRPSCSGLPAAGVLLEGFVMTADVRTSSGATRSYEIISAFTR